MGMTNVQCRNGLRASVKHIIHVCTEWKLKSGVLGARAVLRDDLWRWSEVRGKGGFKGGKNRGPPRH